MRVIGHMRNGVARALAAQNVSIPSFVFIQTFNFNKERACVNIPNGFLANFFLNRPKGGAGSAFLVRLLALIQSASNRGDMGSSPDGVDIVLS